MMESDRELVERLPDPAAQAELESLHYGELFAYVLRKAKSHEDAQEICQDAFFDTFEFLAKPSTPPCECFLAIVFKIANRRIADHWRRFGRQVSVIADLSEVMPASADTGFLKVDLKDFFDTCFDRLPEEERAVLGMLYYEGMGHAEIERALDISASRCRSLREEGMKRIRVMYMSAMGGD